MIKYTNKKCLTYVETTVITITNKNYRYIQKIKKGKFEKSSKINEIIINYKYDEQRNEQNV